MLESDFDEVLGQDATQSQVFAAAQGLKLFRSISIYYGLLRSSSCSKPGLAKGLVLGY